MPLVRKQSEDDVLPDPWIGAREAAEVAGMSRLALYERALQGKVRHQLVAKRRVFNREDCAKLRDAEPASA